MFVCQSLERNIEKMSWSQEQDDSKNRKDSPWLIMDDTKFKIVKDLGTGAYSFVKLAIHKPTQQFVALKYLSKRYYEGRKEVELAFREKRVLQVLNSTWIVRLLGTYQTPGWAVLVLEYVPGIELFTCLVRSKVGLSLKLTRFIAAQLVLFLEYVHEKHILYCDLKPENVMILKTGYIKVIDFGLCDHIGAGGRKYNSCGTPGYFCPDKLKNRSYSFSSDLWSLGVVLFEMLTNNNLFEGNKSKEVWKQVRKMKKVCLKFPPEAAIAKHKEGPVALDLIQKILTFDTAKRLSLPDIKQHPFFHDIDWKMIQEQKYVLKSKSLDRLLSENENSYSLFGTRAKSLVLPSMQPDKTRQRTQSLPPLSFYLWTAW
jgi:protein kinase A